MPSSPEPPLPLEDSLEELYEDAPCGYLLMRADGTIVRANRTFLRSTGYAAQDVVGSRRLEDLLVRGSRIYHETHWRPRLELAGEVREIPAELQRADGSRLPVLVNAVLKRDADGKALAIRASLFDATDRRRYERELVRARDQQAAVARLGALALEGAPLTTLLDEAAQALCDLAQADAVTIAERVEDGLRVAAHRGWPADAMADRGRHLADLLAPLLDGTGTANGLRERYGVHDSVTVGLGAQGRPFGVLALHSWTARRFSEGDAAFAEGMANVLWSAVEHRRADEATRHQALHDPLTGLPNRLLIDHRLAEEVARARRDGSSFALCLLDLDFFKLINDTLGHLAGDDLLRAVADRLRTAVRGADMVARLGGDEFVVLCGDVEAAGGVDAVAGRVTAALRPPFLLGGADHAVRASVGVVVGDGASAPESLLRDADVAMYAAKARGRGQHAQFDHRMGERARERLRVEAELRLGLRRGELRVFYQPVVTSDASRVVGMEALARWQHPRRGLVAPAAFVPVAEECGLIVELGHQVLEQACRQLAAWRGEGILPDGVGMAVNVSARQLAQPAFPAEVARALAGSGLGPTPELLGLEITEAVLMDAGEPSASILAELARLGVGLLLDDFGTGASSLARLRSCPVDTVKVDRAFVSGLGNGGGEDDAIVAAVMAMANALGLGVVAEGVETPEQLGRLRELGCGRIQGHVFARPLPEPEMRALLLASVRAAAR